MATIKDISALTNVSCGAVCRILNNDPLLSVTEETRQKVIDAARELGYKKKAKPVVSRRDSFTLGIVAWFSIEQEIEDSYYLYIRHGIEDYCIRNDIKVIRAFKHDSKDLTNLKQADGLICIGKFDIKDVNRLKKICKNVMFIDMEVDDDKISTITLDYKNAMFDALEYLVKCGHKKIGFLGGKEYLNDHSLYHDYRKEYFIEFCKNNNIAYEDYIVEDRFSTKSGYDMMLSLIRKGKIPTAIFAASDPIAIGAMRALADRGYNVPKDVSIIGFDDTEAASFTSPPLCTIHTPSYNMGAYGATVVHTVLSSKKATPLKIKLPCSLIIRESVSVIL